MGRSVETPDRAIRTVYFDVTGLDPDFGWKDFHVDLVADLQKAFPSLVKPSPGRWHGRECQVILENWLGDFTISEYCGIAALCFIPTGENETAGLAESWGRNINLEKALKPWASSMLHHIGTFSNGEAVYCRHAA